MESTIVHTRLFQYAEKETKPYRLFIQKFKNDWSLVFSGMLAFNLLIAILPMGITSFGIIGLILGNYPDIRNRIKSKIVNLFPPKTNDGLRELINMAFRQLYKDARFALIVGIFFTIIGSSRLFIAIDRCFSIIYRVEERKFFKKYLLAISIVLLFLILIPLLLIASSLPSILLDSIPNASGLFGTYSAGFLSGLLVSFTLFEIIYLIIPNKKMTFKQTWCGSIFAATCLELFMILFPLYARKFMTTYAGQIGFTVLLVLFLFYAAVLLVLGAQINAFFFEHIQPLPVSLGTFISTLIHEYHIKEQE